MKAILLTEYGGVDKLELSDRPEPEPGAGELKVLVASASINPVDWKLRSGALKAYMPLELPTILGRDVAGHVVKVGSGVTAFKVGDPVMGLIRGGYAEYVVAPLEAWAKLPGGLDAADAGALPLVLLTGDQLASAALSSGAGVGTTLLVTGALGAVGRVALWVAKSRGVKVLAGVRRKQLDLAKQLGSDGVVALDDADALARLPALDGIADTVGGETVLKLLSKVKPGGIVGSVVGEPAGAKERGLTVNAFMAHPDSARLAELGQAVATGALVIPIAKRFSLAQAGAAQQFAEAGGALGKVLLTPSP